MADQNVGHINSSPSPLPPPSIYQFSSDPTVSQFAVPHTTYIATHTEKISGLGYQIRYQFIATGGLVFDPPLSDPDPESVAVAGADAGVTVTERPKRDRILLIQRAGHDSMPHRWEVPGGGCDLEDPTILHAVAREVWEETGLVAARIGPLVGPKDGQVFLTRSGKVVCKFHFVVEVEVDTRMDVQEDGGADMNVNVEKDVKGMGMVDSEVATVPTVPTVTSVATDPTVEGTAAEVWTHLDKEQEQQGRRETRRESGTNDMEARRHAGRNTHPYRSLDVPVQVRLDPNEHQAYLWADEDQVKAGRVREVDVEFTTAQQKEVVLEGFNIRKGMRARTRSKVEEEEEEEQAGAE
ncbi:hypothetical protein A1O1_07315 [Capronia coronata CBS 617.96]|uniref:Nudix hydrolase domain-containing protein n=1 Tax=Capronia coronata CBS 617.96 TaxID=1182541 RepID=W9Y368_9EURO|nr:uncharacterized protein A1O1_07315 [Capronia coronata CBS 617.96]EXJ83691.1 hypothetical protein A1O1_07315 [Capronia coronata CBS 617.96]